jgi:hypothetical protein
VLRPAGAGAGQEGGGSIETILLEERRYPPPPEFAAQANAQPEIYERDFDEFWETEGRERVTWFEDSSTAPSPRPASTSC